MVSSLYQPAALIAQQIVPASEMGPDLTSTPQVLTTIDRIILVVTLVLVIAVVARLIAGPKKDLLADAPIRPNRLQEDALVVAILVYLLAAAVASALAQAVTGNGDTVVATIMVGVGAHTAGVAVCLLIAGRYFEGGVPRFLVAEGATGFRASITVTVLVAIAAIGVSPLVRDATTDLILRFAPGFEFAPHPTIEALQDPARPIGVIVALWGGAIVLAPLAEELFFRGLVQTFLVRVVGNRWLAIALASVAFGIVHFQQPHAVPALAVLALLLGYAYERTGSLLPPILIHALFNLKTLVWDAF